MIIFIMFTASPATIRTEKIAINIRPILFSPDSAATSLVVGEYDSGAAYVSGVAVVNGVVCSYDDSTEEVTDDSFEVSSAVSAKYSPALK